MIATIDSPCGRLWVSGDSTYIDAVSWNPIEAGTHTGELDWIIADLCAYFDKKKKLFDGSLIFHGRTPLWTRRKHTVSPETFYHKVLYAMAAIPYGQVQAYSEIAQAIGNPHSARAVGNVCKQNPLPVIVPCHRVVGKNSIGGFSSGIYRKEILLNLEKNSV